jgi:hypothetical protein
MAAPVVGQGAPEQRRTELDGGYLASGNISFVGPCNHRHRDYCIQSNFWKFDLIRTGFTLGEPVFLVKVFRLFRLDGFCWCSECGHSR